MVTAVLLTEPKIQFFDNNGNPLAGGLVYTYAAGTTTPKASYTDSAAGTPNANPVVLDSAGRANIWISGSYKIVVQDSSAVTISTTDNITSFTSASNSTTFSDGTWTMQNASDVTKQMVMDLSGVSTGTTITMTVPNGNFTPIGIATTQTLTNKTLTSPVLNSPTINTPVYAAEAAIASASTTDLASGSSNLVSISGTVTITSFGSNATTTNPIYRGRFLGILTLTHNATSLILPGGANITTAAGDCFVAKYEGSGNWRVIDYTPASGQSVAGSPGGLTTITSGSFGAVTLLDITSIPQTYRALVLHIFEASNTVATRALRVSVNTGLGLGAAGNDSNYTQTAGATVTQTVASNILYTDVTQTAAQVSTVELNFPAYQSGPGKLYNGRASLAYTAGNVAGGAHVQVSGILVDNNAGGLRTGGITGIRITWDNVATGVFDAGTYALYGVN